jgi:hypothetical protein
VDWRSITLSHIVMWRRVLAGDEKRTSASSVSMCMAAIRSFYEWCDGHGLLTSGVVARMTEVKYFAPGTRGGGERGARRRVLVDALQVGRIEVVAPRWIDDDGARDRLAELQLPTGTDF